MTQRKFGWRVTARDHTLLSSGDGVYVAWLDHPGPYSTVRFQLSHDTNTGQMSLELLSPTESKNEAIASRINEQYVGWTVKHRHIPGVATDGDRVIGSQQEVHCVVAATGSGGAELLPVKVVCSSAHYDLGGHLDAAERWAKEQGMEGPLVVFVDEDAHHGMLDLFDWDQVRTTSCDEEELVGPEYDPVEADAACAAMAENQQHAEDEVKERPPVDTYQITLKGYHEFWNQPATEDRRGDRLVKWIHAPGGAAFHAFIKRYRLSELIEDIQQIADKTWDDGVDLEVNHDGEVIARQSPMPFKQSWQHDINYVDKAIAAGRDRKD